MLVLTCSEAFTASDLYGLLGVIDHTKLPRKLRIVHLSWSGDVARSVGVLSCKEKGHQGMPKVAMLMMA